MMVHVPSSHVEIRRAASGDRDVVLRFFDEAIRWFQEIGNTQQWGTRPFSDQPQQVARVEAWMSEPGAWIAELPGHGPVGVLVLGERNDYIPPAPEPELYVRLLLASRIPVARGVGRALLEFADVEARRSGVDYLRVDCYRGGDGRLPLFYEACGYRRTAQFEVGDWPGQILERHLSDEHHDVTGSTWPPD